MKYFFFLKFIIKCNTSKCKFNIKRKICTKLWYTACTWYIRYLSCMHVRRKTKSSNRIFIGVLFNSVTSQTLVWKEHSSCDSVNLLMYVQHYNDFEIHKVKRLLDINCYIVFRTYNDFINYLLLVYFYNPQTHFSSTFSVFKYVQNTIYWNKKREYDVNFSTRLS